MTQPDQAFPSVKIISDRARQGLTKREYFAAMAMQGLCANPHPGSITKVAKMSVECADELIKQLNENP